MPVGIPRQQQSAVAESHLRQLRSGRSVLRAGLGRRGLAVLRDTVPAGIGEELPGELHRAGGAIREVRQLERDVRSGGGSRKNTIGIELERGSGYV